MQETLNNCFESKIRSTILREAKIGEHECQNITACCYTPGRATYFRLETSVESFLHLMLLLFEVLFNHT